MWRCRICFSFFEGISLFVKEKYVTLQRKIKINGKDKRYKTIRTS